jgi:arylamine N-acetyltransferase
MTNDAKLERDQYLIEAYRERLHLSPSTSLTPTLATLRLLTERHLQYIPFENLSMHFDPKTSADRNASDTDTDFDTEPPVVLSQDILIDKILIRRRGGCCLELNGLFRMLLDALGYPTTTFVPCWVFAGPERGHGSKKAKFRTKQSHFVILVSILHLNQHQPDHDYGTAHTVTTTASCSTSTSNSSSYIVDVGLGEPPLGPLVYSHDMLNQAQETPEAMQSRLVWDPRGTWFDGQGRQRKCILLEWLVHAGPQQNQEGLSSSRSSDKVWEPRLQWDINDAPLEHEHDHASSAVSTRPPTGLEANGPSLESFRYVIDILTEKKSSFARKIIVCRLTRTEKMTLSGRTLKITSDRFGADGNHVDYQRQTTVELDTEQEVMTVLKERFGIVLQKREQLCLVKSDGSSNSKLWDHL